METFCTRMVFVFHFKQQQQKKTHSRSTNLINSNCHEVIMTVHYEPEDVAVLFHDSLPR